MLVFFDNALAFARVEIKHSWSKWNQPVDYKEWGMPAHMVNAYYNPQKNLIVFPAAILQAPFYDLHQSSSANYGGIGAVIAHEISHAFDTNGASFDENGSLKVGGQRVTMQPLKKKHRRLSTSLMVKNLTAQLLTVINYIRKRCRPRRNCCSARSC